MKSLSEALIITRREVRDSVRDWRIVAPILILTLVFPYIMNLSTRVAITFVETYNATIIPLRLIPFGLLIVGFFPISFSLVIALETFVGERERNSLEPLLASPLSDASLYFGKLLAAILPPLIASYLGVLSYLVSLYFSMNYLPDPMVVLQILVITSMETCVMVAGAVVISSHTTSVRAANLLASFVIIPMAFLLQGESLLLFWGNYGALWYIIAALAVVNVILLRMGVLTFNREAILAREIDELDLRKIARRFYSRFAGSGGFSLRRIYFLELPRLLNANRLPLVMTLLVVIGACAFGGYLASEYPLPARFLAPLRLEPGFENSLRIQGNEFLPRLDTASILVNNVRSLALSTALGAVTFGSGALLLLIAPLAIVGFITAQFAHAGVNPITFLGAFVMPHGVFELPAAIVGTAFALRLGAVVMAPRRAPSGSDSFVEALADWAKVFVFLVVPLLLLAALIEATLTPQIVIYFFGG